MATSILETLEEVRNRLIIESRLQPEHQRTGYVNGVLDMYNLVKKREDSMLAEKKENR